MDRLGDVVQGFKVFGEVTIDRTRVSSGVLSVIYQVRSTVVTPLAVKPIIFQLSG